ncbi:hypothetical protein M758_UG302700 [Ceratodon purpureus]|nr:hypothetical protein M758_UG302700 [Ceratodon purpureus]
MDTHIFIPSSSALPISITNTDSVSPRDRATDVIRQWAANDAKASPSQIQNLTLLLDTNHLLHLPRLKGMRRLASPPSPAEIRHYFYRHAAKILGWKERSTFGDNVYHVVKFVLWPDVLEDTSQPPRKRCHHATQVSHTVDRKKARFSEKQEASRSPKETTQMPASTVDCVVVSTEHSSRCDHLL